MHRVTTYLVAIASVALAIAVKYPFASLGANHPFLLLPAAIVVSSWYGGRGPGLAATILAALGAVLLYLPPDGLGVLPGDGFALAALLAEGGLIVVITVGLHDARERALRDAEEAEQARRAATLALQMREELLRLWTQKLTGPLAHVLASTQRSREALRDGDREVASAALARLSDDVELLQRTAERWLETAAPEAKVS